MATLAQARFTPEEYLERERTAEYKSEYDAGEILPMPGASRNHNRITLDIVCALGNQLEESACELYASDMRVHVSLTDLYTYPDVVAVCGEPRFTGWDVDTLLNPTLLIEVLSDSTESRDRGEKFAQYQSISSLQEYVLVDQYRPHIEVFRRQAEGQWLYSRADGLEASVSLSSVECTLALRDAYRRVSFEAAPEPIPPPPDSRDAES